MICKRTVSVILIVEGKAFNQSAGSPIENYGIKRPFRGTKNIWIRRKGRKINNKSGQRSRITDLTTVLRLGKAALFFGCVFICPKLVQAAWTGGFCVSWKTNCRNRGRDNLPFFSVLWYDIFTLWRVSPAGKERKMQGNQTEKYTLLYGRLSNEDKREGTSLSIQHQ